MDRDGRRGRPGFVRRSQGINILQARQAAGDLYAAAEKIGVAPKVLLFIEDLPEIITDIPPGGIMNIALSDGVTHPVAGDPVYQFINRQGTLLVRKGEVG